MHSVETVAAPAPSITGTSRELLRLAIPLILANSFTTIQFTVDRAFLSQYNPDAMGASFQGAMIFWLFMSLLHGTAGYVSTFVAQYTGAGRPERVGPAVWQGIYFAIIAGSLFWLLWPISPDIFAYFKHGGNIPKLESDYFRSLCGAAVPMALVSAFTGFFSGRGDTWTVLGINALGTLVNVVLDYAFIFGNWGCPEMGIAGAGWATVLGSWASALLAFGLFLRPSFRQQYGTLSGWKPEADLMRRLARFGIPVGLQWMMEALSFTFFLIFVGKIGTAELNATGLAFTLNSLAFLPMMGLGQAVSILVGQRIGEKRQALAEKSTYLALKWSLGYMTILAAIFVCLPELLLWGFKPDANSPQFESWPAVELIVPKLLLCVAFYSLADSVNLTFAFALRGAGDTRYVTWLTFALAWPIMILPTYLIMHYGGNIYMAWGAATAYIFMVALCFWLRFRTGKWKSMKVIEDKVV